MSARKFTYVDDLHLIDYVQEYPVVYDRCNNFTHGRLRDAWKMIADRMGRQEDVCKGRWRDIRDHYFKLRRKISSGDQTCTKWNLYDKLSFLDKAKRIKSTKIGTRVKHEGAQSYPSEDAGTHHLAPSGTCNTEHDFEPEICFKVEEGIVPTEYVSLPLHSEGESGSRVEERFAPSTIVSTESECEDEDDVDVFLKSIAMTVKRFPPPLRAEAKLKILSVVSALEFPTLSTVYTESVCHQ